MEKTVIRIVLSAAMLMPSSAVLVRAQQNVVEIAVAKCDDGSLLKGNFITFDGRVKSVRSVNELSMLCITDSSSNVTSIFQLPSMQLIGKVEPKDGAIWQVTRDGYLTTKSSFWVGRNRPRFYNFKNEKIWESKQNCFLASRKDNVVICDANIKGNDFVAYDMTTGNELWRNTITHRKHFPWHGLYRDERDPDIYYLMGDSLLRLNILTGETKSAGFEGGCKAGLKGFQTILEQKIFPSAEWRREAYSSFFTSGNYATGTCSNWLVSGDSIFVADAENVYCYDRDLNKLWSTALPKEIGCKSHLTLDGDILRMMGFGVAFMAGKTVKNGKPFIAAYDRHTGRQQGLSVIKTDRKLIGGIYVQGRAYWQDSKSFYYTNEGDTTATRIDWKPKTKRLPESYYPNRVICDTVGVMNGEEMGLICTDAHQLVVELYGKDVYLIHDDGSSEMLNADSVYFHDSGRLYSTNSSTNPKHGEQPRHYIVKYPDSWRIQKSFPLVGMAWMDDNDNLIIKLKSAVGTVNLKE